jgi:hypothetical protein
MVGEDEIEAAGVDVDRFPRCRSIIAEHSMCQPGRPRPQGDSQPITPSGEGFHRTKSAWVLLVGGDLDAGAGDRRIAVAAAERAVTGVARHVEEDMAVRLVSVAGLDQPRDHCDHVRHMLGRVRRDVGRSDAERAHVVQIMLLVAGGDHRRVDALVGRGLDDLVVDVRDVAGVDKLVGPISMTEQTGETSNTTAGRALPIWARL